MKALYLSLLAILLIWGGIALYAASQLAQVARMTP